MRIPALMYHDVVAPGHADASGFPGAAAASYKLDVDNFRAHLDALGDTGLRFGSVLGADCGDVLLTFDDGGASVTAIAEALQARGMIGHFLITTARIDTPAFASRAQIRQLHAGGHVVGSHSHSHPAEISRLDEAALLGQWRDSVACLVDILGSAVTVASVPGGFYSRRVGACAMAAGIDSLFTSEPGTRVHALADGRVFGRFTVRRGMRPQQAVALARGGAAARQRQWLAWNGKKPLKRWARPCYRAVRRRLFANP